MPIRLNLLAEAQEQEELRRRDPVKRIIGIGVLGVILLLAWSSSLQLRKMIVKGQLNRLQAQIDSRTNAYNQVLSNQKRLVDARQELVSLRELATNRFLEGSLLNALQHATAANVQLTRLSSRQAFTVTPGTPPVIPRPGTHQAPKPGRPARVSEKSVITLDAKDSSPTPGDDAVARFKSAIENCAYLHRLLGKTGEVRLASLSPPQSGSGSRPFVQFSLTCRLPEVTR